jgi:hypothetical protein
MPKTHRVSTTAALIVCLVGSPWGGILFASEAEPSSREAQATTSLAAAVSVDRPATTSDLFSPSNLERSLFTLTDARLTADARVVESSSFAQRGGYGGRWRRGHRDGAVAALLLGAAASIAGTAVLVYANRPECSTNQTAGGCGYGTKVVGGAVLSAGIVGLVLGAVTWR